METPENGRKRRNIADIDLRTLPDAGLEAETPGERYFRELMPNLRPQGEIVIVGTRWGSNELYRTLQDQEC